MPNDYSRYYKYRGLLVTTDKTPGVAPDSPGLILVVQITPPCSKLLHFVKSSPGATGAWYGQSEYFYTICAFETILAVENIFGSPLREYAIKISRGKYALRQEILNKEFQTADVYHK